MRLYNSYSLHVAPECTKRAKTTHPGLVRVPGRLPRGGEPTGRLWWWERLSFTTSPYTHTHPLEYSLIKMCPDSSCGRRKVTIPLFFLVAVGKPGQEMNTCNDQGEAVVSSKGDVTFGHSRSRGRTGIYQTAPRNMELQLCHSEPSRLLPKASLTFLSHG